MSETSSELKPEQLHQQVQRLAVDATWTALKTALAVTLVVLLSVFLYGTFYYAYIPQSMQMKPLYFQAVEKLTTRKQPDGSTVRISQNVLHADLHLSASESGRFLTPGLVYHLTMEMDMPDSEVNLNAGTFMLRALLYDKNEKLLASSSRLVMLRYRTWLLRILDTLAYAPLYLIGFWEQNQIRKIEVVRGFRENAYKSTSFITLEIDNANVQLYEATLRFQVQYSGLRYLMYYWPITSTVLGIATIGFFLVIIVGSSWYTMGGWTARSKHPQTVLKHSGSLPSKPSMEHIGSSQCTDHEAAGKDDSTDRPPETGENVMLLRRRLNHDTQ